MQIEIWTMDDCPECDAVKADLALAQARYTEARVEDLIDHPDRGDVQVQLAMQNMAAPVIRVDGTFTDHHALRGALELPALGGRGC